MCIRDRPELSGAGRGWHLGRRRAPAVLVDRTGDIVPAQRLDQRLAPGADASRAYLLGTVDGGRLPASAVRFAFSAGPLDEATRAAASAQTLLCPTRDDHNQFCASMTQHSAAILTAEAQRAPADMQLDSAELDEFLRAHPEALLIDVREPYEFAATAAPGPGGRAARSVPLSQIAGQAAEWLRGEQRPLVFFCRSGNRSMKATQCLRRLGHQQSYSLSGGLALAA